MSWKLIVHPFTLETTSHIRHELSIAGFRVEQSFNLRSILGVASESSDSAVGLYTPELNILLVYGPSPTPITLLISGYHENGWITFAEARRSPALETIVQILTQTNIPGLTVEIAPENPMG